MFIKNAHTNETLRVTFTITLCMLAGKLLQLDSPVYLALYPTIVMTKGKDYSWLGLFNTFLPTLLAASCALLVSEVFHDHPFIIWTISLIFFDWMRRRANTPAKLGAMLMPTFNWILIIVFSQHTVSDMPMRIHEILISMAVTTVVTKAMVYLFPQEKRGKPPAFKAQSVSYQHRFVSMGLIGTGVAFLMMVDLISATFCMVPVIAAATQFSRDKFREVVERRFITQVGGCALAVVFAFVMAGHQSTVGFYALGLGCLVFLLANWMATAQGPSRDIHADALLATMLPIQLYMGNTSLGLESTYLRAWELTVTLGILFILHQLTRSQGNYDRKHHRHS
ncbi:hypothetical protein BIT28_02600 [Photobacterium proteolyticum]|uniref:DUF2955 domain-containing protein n=1 Tax=Photobacterium proteolyticum TaxID=1903952 RepID=A0A1Q9GMJ7_9GAMM|nr:DUF2955 domain-containing protein [Photobacterium proteolyticum]OLQ75707.1 hypothetical protein BIT28_02600 [Photobacterium proteolyticum]